MLLDNIVSDCMALTSLSVASLHYIMSVHRDIVNVCSSMISVISRLICALLAPSILLCIVILNICEERLRTTLLYIRQ